MNSGSLDKCGSFTFFSLLTGQYHSSLIVLETEPRLYIGNYVAAQFYSSYGKRKMSLCFYLPKYCLVCLITSIEKCQNVKAAVGKYEFDRKTMFLGSKGVAFYIRGIH